jgi:hypothetical protein
MAPGDKHRRSQASAWPAFSSGTPRERFFTLDEIDGSAERASSPSRGATKAFLSQSVAPRRLIAIDTMM